MFQGRTQNSEGSSSCRTHPSALARLCPHCNFSPLSCVYSYTRVRVVAGENRYIRIGLAESHQQRIVTAVQQTRFFPSRRSANARERVVDEGEEGTAERKKKEDAAEDGLNCSRGATNARRRIFCAPSRGGENEEEKKIQVQFLNHPLPLHSWSISSAAMDSRSVCGLHRRTITYRPYL